MKWHSQVWMWRGRKEEVSGRRCQRNGVDLKLWAAGALGCYWLRLAAQLLRWTRASSDTAWIVAENWGRAPLL